MATSFATRARAEAALATLRWRGPDEARVVGVGGWWLGVARLVISDASAGQPIVSARSGAAIAFNGALTDGGAGFAEHAADLVSRNDAEVPLRAYEVRGAEGLFPRAGHHALALVDPRSDEVWLARDREGEKPLWLWTVHERVVAFASSVAALVALGCAVELDERERARFLRFGWQPEPGVATPGHRIVEAPSGVHRVDGAGRFHPHAVKATPDVATSTHEDLASALAAAACRTARTEVGAALALSGGVDSACLAAALARGGLRLPAYQWRAVGAPRAERDLATLVARHTGLTLRGVDSGPEILRALPTLTAQCGLPLGDPSLLAVHALGRAVAADGNRVLLGGEGGDELFLGYARQRALAWLPGLPCRWLARRLAGTSKPARLLRALVAEDACAELLAPSAQPTLRRTLRSDALAGVAVRAIPEAEGHRGLARAHAIDRHGYLRHDLLPKLDVALMAAGVEGRCPFLDPEVTQCAAARTAPVRRNLGKRVLRAAFAPDLPAAVLAQGKTGFGIPLDRWWREDPFLAEVLTDPRTEQREHLERAGVRAAFAAHRAGKAQLGHALYLVVALELWLRWKEGRA